MRLSTNDSPHNGYHPFQGINYNLIIISILICNYKMHPFLRNRGQCTKTQIKKQISAIKLLILGKVNPESVSAV